MVIRYGSKKSGGTKHIPHGYDWWLALKGNSKYYNYTLSINGTARFFENQYLTDVMSDYAIDFLNQGFIKTSPFFMTLATPACHAPFTPADRHKVCYLNETVVRTPSFNATPYNKHWLLQMKPTSLPENVEILDEIQKNRLQTLLAVDDMVDRVVEKLKDLNVLDNTYIIFTSDNGYHIGQFSQPWDKRQPYQTDIKVPFLISGPKIKKKSLSSFPISSVDILPTILDLANVKTPEKLKIDGKSFKEVLFEKIEKMFQRRVYIEYHGMGSGSTVENQCAVKEKWADPEHLLDGRSQYYVASVLNVPRSKVQRATSVGDIFKRKKTPQN
ncbi:unnamed protein product [Brassicogethes aeneus]|uniref:Sulfatase N-terminal domain-containing protein n=1 Tax=Brassicogethes aeneus TaxID=1431903 RepID=A0A9P0ATQ4_BRAAE|nr:unnamed protein product [Brassicogethes aeneus]